MDKMEFSSANGGSSFYDSSNNTSPFRPSFCNKMPHDYSLKSKMEYFDSVFSPKASIVKLQIYASELEDFILSFNKTQLTTFLGSMLYLVQCRILQNGLLIKMTACYVLTETKLWSKQHQQFNLQQRDFLLNKHPKEALECFLKIYCHKEPYTKVFDIIRKICPCDPGIEQDLKLLYCETLLTKHTTEDFRRILFENKKHFLSHPEKFRLGKWQQTNIDIYVTVLFHLSLPCKQITVDAETTRLALTQLQSIILNSSLHTGGYLYKEIQKYLISISTEGTLKPPNLMNLFRDELKNYPVLQISLVLYVSKIFKCETSPDEYIQFTRQHQDLVLSSAEYITLDIYTHEEIRQQYCEILIYVIYECDIAMEMSQAAFFTLLKNSLHIDLYEVLEHFMTKSEKNLVFTATTLIDWIQCSNEMDGKINEIFRKRDVKLNLLLIIKCSKQFMDTNLNRENTQMLKRHNLIIMLNAHLIHYILSFHGYIRDIKKLPFIPSEVYCEVLLHCGLYGDFHKKTISTLLENDLHKYLFNAFVHFMGKTDNEAKITCLKLLDSFPSSRNKDATLKLKIIVICFKKFIKNEYYHEIKQLIKQNRDFILSKAGTFDNGNEYPRRGFLGDNDDDDYIFNFYDDDDYDNGGENPRRGFLNDDDDNTPCEYRQQFSLILLHLLQYSHSSQTQTTEVEIAIQQFKTSLLTRKVSFKDQCYCYRGSSDCTMSEKQTKQDKGWRNQKSSPAFHSQTKEIEKTFSNIILKMEIQSRISVEQELEGEVLGLVGNLNDTEQLEVISCGLTTCFDKLDKKKVLKIGIIKLLQILCKTKLKLEMKDLIVRGIANVLSIQYYRNYVNLSRLILDVNLMADHYKSLSLKHFTLKLGEMFDKKEDKINSEEKVIYQCFCVLRHESKYRDTPIVNTDIYKKHFKFISTMEKEEEIDRLASLIQFLVMMVLLLSCVANGGHNTSAELKKYLSLKYAYDNAILFLLWCSGDVEINPGPTLKKLQKVPPSIKERNWIHDACSTTLKGLKGIPNDAHSNKDLWHEPDNWPLNEKFYDPRNPKGFKRNNETDKRLLECLYECCQAKNISLPTHLEEEMKAWKSGTKHLLFELYISRQEKGVIKEATENLHPYRDSHELKTSLREVQISIDFAFVTFNSKTNNSKSEAEVQRDLKVTLGRISKGLNPLEKSDGLWKCPPDKWNPKNSQLYTNADAKRPGVEENRELINELIRYCEQNNKNIPVDCQPMIAAWKQNKMEEVCKLHTIWSNITIIQHSLTYLEVEEVLDKPTLKKELKDIGLNIDKLDFLRCQTVLKSKVPKPLKRSSNSINKSKKTLSQPQSEQTKKTGQLNIKNVATSSTAGGCSSQQSQPKQKSKGKKSLRKDKRCVYTPDVSEEISTSQNKKSNKRKKSFSKEEEENRGTKKHILSKDDTKLFLEVFSPKEQQIVQSPPPGTICTQTPPSGTTDTSVTLVGTTLPWTGDIRAYGKQRDTVPDEILNTACSLLEEYDSKLDDNQSSDNSLETDSVSDHNNRPIRSVNNSSLKHITKLFTSDCTRNSDSKLLNGHNLDSHSFSTNSVHGSQCTPASKMRNLINSCKEPDLDSPSSMESESSESSSKSPKSAFSRCDVDSPKSTSSRCEADSHKSVSSRCEDDNPLSASSGCEANSPKSVSSGCKKNSPKSASSGYETESSKSAFSGCNADSPTALPGSSCISETPDNGTSKKSYLIQNTVTEDEENVTIPEEILDCYMDEWIEDYDDEDNKLIMDMDI